MTSASAMSEMLDEMSACAFRLGTAFAAEAEAADDWGRKRELFQLFDRCFFSVRVAIALQLRLGREARSASDRDPPETEPAEGLQIERPDALERADTGLERERDRESDREQATLPLLLSTLQGVATDAGALPGPTPAALPTLRELLARMGVEPSPAPAASRTPAAPLRSRLALSSSAAVAVLPERPATPRAALPLRKATGPPRRR